MIAELFYPKELKDIIADLRAKGDLNEEAVLFLQALYIKQLVIWLLVSCIIFYLGGLYIGFFVLAGFHFFIYLDLRSYLLIRCMPFVEGERKKLRLFKKQHYRFGVVLELQGDDGGILKTPKLREAKFKDLDIGQTIECFVHSQSTKLVMPNIEKITRKFCLSKSKLQGG